ncbi:hypothetical protein [Streptomyces sp. NPDC018347]|uniref:hypothetical protein n=1 Tax=Streptomyces sp. NPDC018347 TaxID=3157193 RepID=UPI0033C3EC57
MGSALPQPLVVTVRESAEAGAVSGPRLHIAPHIISARGAHGDVSASLGSRPEVEVGLLADGESEILRAVRGEARLGADWIKFGGTGGFFSPSNSPDQVTYVSVQFEALLAGDLWHRNAAHANAVARRLADRLRDTCGVAPARPVQSNAVLVRLPPEVIAALRRTQPFQMSDPGTGEVRWMCSFDTTERDVDAFAAVVLRELGRPR